MLWQCWVTAVFAAVWAAPTSGLSCADPALSKAAFCNVALPVADRVADLGLRLNVTQQIGQMTGRAAAIPELGMIEYNFGGEALHGVWANCVNLTADGVTDGTKVACPTQFGSPLSMGCSFNRRLWRAMADATSTEVRALYGVPAAGAHSLEGLPFGLTYYAPNVNVMRDPRWGRNEEVPSEDPFMNGEYGYEFTKGFQEGTEAAQAEFGTTYWKATVVAKHFAAYSLETSTIPSTANPAPNEGAGFVNRHMFNAVVSDQDLAETYFPAFHRTVEAGAAGIMCSYNAINGVPACVNDEMLNGVLRGDMGFEGIVATDCGALADADTKHNYSTQVCPSCTTPELRGEKISQLAVEAGVDNNCGSYLGSHMPGVMAKGMLKKSVLDASTARLLAIRFKLGLFEPTNAAVPKFGLEVVDSAAHRALALKQARQAVVLLQNKPYRGKTVLPLKKGLKIAMIGPNANASLNLLSGYHGSPPFLVSPLQAMGVALGADHVGYEVGCNVTNVSWGGIGGGSPGHPPPGAPPPPSPAEAAASIAAAVELAQKSDVAILGLGLCGDNYWGGGAKEDPTCVEIQETETTDRLNLALPGWQLPLLEAVVATGKPVVVFVINAGPVDLSWAKENVAAIVSAGYGGEFGGQAIADVLTGAYNPGGALSYTLYTQKFASMTPYDSMEMRPNKTNGSPGRTHRFLEGCPDCLSWPFGFGSSYTTFALSWAAPPPTTVVAGDASTFELSIKNTGGLLGDVVVTCFVVATKQSAVERPPVQQLWAFDRVEGLEPGGTAALAFTLTPQGRSLVTEAGRRVVPTGTFAVDCKAGGTVVASSTLSVVAALEGGSSLE